MVRKKKVLMILFLDPLYDLIKWNKSEIGFFLGIDEYMKLIRKKWLHDNATKENSQRGNGGGLRELSCLDLQKKVVFLPFSTPFCAEKIRKKRRKPNND